MLRVYNFIVPHRSKCWRFSLLQRCGT